MNKKKFYSSTAWKWFSKYVLLKHSANGVCKCASCGKHKYVNDRNMHVGHLIKVFTLGGRNNFSTAFVEKNVLPQCHQCNVIMCGNELKMLDAIENKYGEGTYKGLKKAANIPLNLDEIHIKALSQLYRTKFNDLVKLKGNPWKKTKLL